MDLGRRDRQQRGVILHIPHSSREIPDGLRDQFVLDDEGLSAELDLMTDAFTAELFFWGGAMVVRLPFSRLLVDVERFSEDDKEPMSSVGMGMIYARTSSVCSSTEKLTTPFIEKLTTPDHALV